MRIVIDTNVVISGIRSRIGASSVLLRLVDLGKAIHLLNVPLAFEYEEKCMDARHVLASGLSTNEVLEIVDNIIGKAQCVPTYYLWRPSLSDPDDEMVLEAAIHGHADAIVTFNQKDFGDTPKLHGVEVWSPAKAIKEILR